MLEESMMLVSFGLTNIGKELGLEDGPKAKITIASNCLQKTKEQKKLETKREYIVNT